ncbi:dihydropteroate synthase [Planctomonas sp. JC2975]|nr:dihydropteroate synthase [Planctomonas sp. JC2975]NNC12074.1 dihydropteroate synthase [Planctomonas sp. JC2975]
MGVLNVTPDSFSDGGRWASTDAAIAHGLELAAQGAHIVDVGGESTRPGAERVPVPAELERVLPVVRELAGRGIRVSIDTMNSETARAAVDAGAQLVNDVSGGLADPAMGPLVADRGVDYVVMHWRGHSRTMNDLAHYTDAAREIREELFRRVDALEADGVAPERIIVDPGLGFAKTSDHNWDVLRHLRDFETAGLPVLLGASRKRFLSDLMWDGATPQDRDLPSAVVAALAAREGVWGVRVHDVVSTRIALDVVRHWDGGSAAMGTESGRGIR